MSSKSSGYLLFSLFSGSCFFLSIVFNANFCEVISGGFEDVATDLGECCFFISLPRNKRAAAGKAISSQSAAASGGH